MRLLVSVRSAAEAGEAVAGGADIVDAKEPAHGALGAVDPTVLQAIAAVLPPAMPLSLALGDCHRPEAAAELVRGAIELLGPTRAERYLKIGFHGVDHPETLDQILGAAVAAASGSGFGIVAAAYADHSAIGSPAVEAVTAAAGRRRAAGVLVDTWGKDGPGLPGWMDAGALRQWVARSRALGLLTAVAGSLTLEIIPQVLDCGADVIGVRGAACEGGREGALRRKRVAALRAAIGGCTPDAAAGSVSQLSTYS